MEQKKRRLIRPRTALFLGLGVGIILMAAGAAIALAVFRAPNPAAIERSFTSYIEGIAQAGKLVLLETRHRLAIRETVPGRLFGDSTVGRFLDIRSDAVIELYAWADLSLAVDFLSPDTWSVHYDPAGGGRLVLAVPPLGMLTPAVLTETIEARAADRSIFLDEARLIENAKRALTTRFVEEASALIDDPDLRLKATAALEAIARSFAESAGIAVATVDVAFAPPDR
ncbi:MAG: hypothetical protein E4H20_07825 [Spirochaetales bacterium]|nr:MAG: hypothetical protein E4H20_07825 [Spirochaetales bacterium]